MGTASADSGSDQQAYMDYVEMCQIAGKTPLTPIGKWIAAGRPKS